MPRRRSIPLRAIDITSQILRAARFAHRRGVVHRDLKPHNVMIDEEGRAKVTDFGIARAGASDMTETGSIMGTAQYLSPEQAQGKPVSPQSDLYSIGVILFELLTGQVPFHADAAVSIALKHVAEEAPSVRELNPAVPEELDQIVAWALQKDPSAARPTPTRSSARSRTPASTCSRARAAPPPRSSRWPRKTVVEEWVEEDPALATARGGSRSRSCSSRWPASPPSCSRGPRRRPCPASSASR